VQTLLQQLLEGSITSKVTCCTCDTASESRQPVWVMTVPLPPDPATPDGGQLDSSASAHRSNVPGLSRSAPKKGSKAYDIGAVWAHRGPGMLHEGRKTPKKELKALEKAEKRIKRRERKLEKQRRDQGAEPEDISDGELSGARPLLLVHPGLKNLVWCKSRGAAAGRHPSCLLIHRWYPRCICRHRVSWHAM
jgi:hypothetical protein